MQQSLVHGVENNVPGSGRIWIALLVAALAACSGGSTDQDESSSPSPLSPANRAPSISGAPAASVTLVGDAFIFTPTASDPDGDSLTFSVDNRPSWAAFDASTGALSGTPAVDDVGNYMSIRISVSDGALSSSLSPFDVSVQVETPLSLSLNWDAPTQNTDGSTLSDLSGFAILYGTRSGNYPTRVDIDDASQTTLTLEGLSAGTYYIVAIAKRANGTESAFSEELVVTVP